MDSAGIGIGALTATAAGIAALHTLAPDHWMPFAALGRAQGWSRGRVMRTTAVAGLAHVGASIGLGLLGLGLGYALDGIQLLQAGRGDTALYLLIAFGSAYAVWGLWRARKWHHGHGHEDGSVHAHPHEGHHHHGSDHGHHHSEGGRRGGAARKMTTWGLLVVFVLGPCEPLIPIMFASFAFGWWGIIIPAVAFAVTTIAVMVALAALAHAGFQVIRARWLDRYAHATSGAAIALTGVLVLALGI